MNIMTRRAVLTLAAAVDDDPHACLWAEFDAAEREARHAEMLVDEADERFAAMKPNSPWIIRIPNADGSFVYIFSCWREFDEFLKSVSVTDLPNSDRECLEAEVQRQIYARHEAFKQAAVASGRVEAHDRFHDAYELLSGLAEEALEVEAAKTQWRLVADQLRLKAAKLAALMEEAEVDVLAHMTFPKEHRAKLHSTNPLERLNGEIKRRINVVGIFPNVNFFTRLVGVILLKQNDE